MTRRSKKDKVLHPSFIDSFIQTRFGGIQQRTKTSNNIQRNFSHPFGVCTLQVDVDGRASKGDDTVKAVVRAANGLSAARVASGTDDAKRRASNTDKTSDASESNTKDAEQASHRGRARLLDRVTALNGPSVALVRGTRRKRMRRSSICNCLRGGDRLGMRNWHSRRHRLSVGERARHWHSHRAGNSNGDRRRDRRRRRVRNRRWDGRHHSPSHWDSDSRRLGMGHRGRNRDRYGPSRSRSRDVHS